MRLVLVVCLFLILLFCSAQENNIITFTSSYQDSILHYRKLTHDCFQAGDISASKKAFLKLQSFGEINRLKDVILKKYLFFVPDSFVVPKRKEISSFIIKPIKESDAQLDYAAIMANIDHLTGVLGNTDWPGELTFEEDKSALACHEWEFDKRIGFIYKIMNCEESKIIGCIYIYPSRLDNFDSEIVFWVTENEANKGADKIFFDYINDWLEKDWPFDKIIFPGRTITWDNFFTLLDNQDKKYTLEEK